MAAAHPAPAPGSSDTVYICSSCGQAIEPLGSEGILDIAGNRFCSKCSELAVAVDAAPPPAAEPDRAPYQPSGGFVQVSRPGGAAAARAFGEVVRYAITLAVLGGIGALIYWAVNRVKPIAVAISEKPIATTSEIAHTPPPDPNTAAPARPGAGKAASSASPGASPGRPVVQPKRLSSLRRPPAKKAEPESKTGGIVVHPNVGVIVSPGGGDEAPPPPSEPVKAPEYGEGLKSADALCQAGKYSAALAQLDQLKGAYGTQESWAGREKEWLQARQNVDKAVKEYQEEATETREGLKSATLQQLEPLLAVWKPRAELHDELGSKPAKELMQAIAAAKARWTEQARLKRQADIAKQMDEYEKLLKGRPSGRTLEPAFKFFDEVEAEMRQTPAWAGMIAERYAGLRFDAQLARDGDLGIFRALIKGSSDLLYDFSSSEQFEAWAYNRPGGKDAGNFAEWVAAKGRVVVHAQGDCYWEGKERKSMGMLCLPFLFRPESWVFEADVAALDPQESTNAPDCGILIWEGGPGVLRLGIYPAVNKNKQKELVVLVSGNTGNAEKYSKDVLHLPLPYTETVRLSMSGQPGAITFAVAAQNMQAPVTARVPIGFAVRHLGLYVRTRGLGAAAAFDNVHLRAAPDPEALKRQTSVRRDLAVMKAKDDWSPQGRALAADKDGSDKSWRQLWTPQTPPGSEGLCQVNYKGREGVWRTQPFRSDMAARWTRRVALNKDKAYTLHLEVAGHEPKFDWDLVVKANGQEILNQRITGLEWKIFDLPLTAFAGQEVELELLNQGAGEYLHDYAYWDAVQIRTR
jgi:hypothetical protein